MDQTKFFQLRTALWWGVHDNKTVDNQMKPTDIDDWYYHIMKVALGSKASNNSNITWMEYENITIPIKESPCPRVANVQPWRQINPVYINPAWRSFLQVKLRRWAPVCWYTRIYIVNTFEMNCKHIVLADLTWWCIFIHLATRPSTDGKRVPIRVKLVCKRSAAPRKPRSHISQDVETNKI